MHEGLREIKAGIKIERERGRLRGRSERDASVGKKFYFSFVSDQ